MSSHYSIAEYRAAAGYVRQHTHRRPIVAITLGSGLGGLADQAEQADVIPYQAIPGWPPARSSVEGHKLRLVIGTLEGHDVLFLQGRQHFYEGYTMQEVTFHVRVLQALEIDKFIVTNAAGGLNRSFAAGELMRIADHINLTGTNPLIGPNDLALGPRFPDMGRAYDPALGELARLVAAQANIPLREGVYIGLTGPSYETPAEVRMLRGLGADAVGMSTVSEVIVARHAGIRVLGISTISNVAIDSLDTGLKVEHEEVMAVGKQIAPRLEKLIRGVVRAIDTV